MSKKNLLSGVKPTGQAHIGNYFGAMKQFVDLQNSGQYDCHLFIADYHALNLIQDKEQMKNLTLELALDYLAIGLDPKKSILFKQSDISAHTELAWIFDTITTMPYLMRAHAYKDAEAKDKEINVGTFNYPVLMAADILLYDTDVVPVGQDQKQHVEYARDIADKFNHIFGGPKNANNEPISPVFKLPEDLIMKDVAVVPGIDGRKMSKSYNNTIPLFATREQIQKAVMSIVTDAGLGAIGADGKPSDGIPANVYAIHKLFKTEAELKPLYEANRGKYKILKERLIEDIDTFIKPMRERREQLSRNPKKVMKILEKGAKQAGKVAQIKLHEVKKAIGVL
ncbi:MAG: tryptophan--tRNA ligase [Candidatus Taylorbacteria bacterium]